MNLICETCQAYVTTCCYCAKDEAKIISLVERRQEQLAEEYLKATEQQVKKNNERIKNKRILKNRAIAWKLKKDRK